MRPVRAKASSKYWRFKAFALTGRQVCVRNYPGRCPGLGASALSGRVGDYFLKFVFLFELFCFLLHYILDVNGIEWNRAAAQLRYVETLQAIIVEGWFPLWKNKRLVSLALAVYVAEVRLAVKSVVALAGKDKPSAGMRPAVVGIALLAVHDAEAVYLTRL